MPYFNAAGQPCTMKQHEAERAKTAYERRGSELTRSKPWVLLDAHALESGRYAAYCRHGYYASYEDARVVALYVLKLERAVIGKIQSDSALRNHRA